MRESNIRIGAKWPNFMKMWGSFPYFLEFFERAEYPFENSFWISIFRHSIYSFLNQGKECWNISLKMFFEGRKIWSYWKKNISGLSFFICLIFQKKKSKRISFSIDITFYWPKDFKGDGRKQSRAKNINLRVLARKLFSQNSLPSATGRN